MITAPLVAAADAAGRQRDQTTTPIQHVVVLMQEHHSFDSYFGTYPGADGIPAGTCMPVDPGGRTWGASSRTGSPMAVSRTIR